MKKFRSDKKSKDFKQNKRNGSGNHYTNLSKSRILDQYLITEQEEKKTEKLINIKSLDKVLINLIFSHFLHLINTICQ